MVRPLENQERLNTGEYINRVRQSERGHGANARDFAYEIHELSDEQRRDRQPDHEFGKDTYEHAPGDGSNSEEASPPRNDPPAKNSPPNDDSSLDITV
jgi:hypothetical protein